jgi:hypothetical protein
MLVQTATRTSRRQQIYRMTSEVSTREAETATAATSDSPAQQTSKTARTIGAVMGFNRWATMSRRIADAFPPSRV